MRDELLIDLYAHGSEQGLVSCLMLDAKEAFAKCMQLGITEADFGDVEGAAIFSMASQMHAKGLSVDICTVLDERVRLGEQKAVALAILLKWCRCVPSSIDVNHYLRRVKEDSIRRRLRAQGQVMAQKDEDRAVGELIEQAKQEIDRLGRETAVENVNSLVGAVSEATEMLEGRQDHVGVCGFGLDGFDGQLGQLQRGEVCVVGARPNIGKSAIAVQVARMALREGRNAAVFWLEDTPRNFVMRYAAQDSGVSASFAGRAPNVERSSYRDAMHRLENSGLFLGDLTLRSVAQIGAKARELHSQKPVDLIVVDYLQKIKVTDMGKDRPREQEISRACDLLTELAAELNCAVLATAQLNRGPEKDDRFPQMSDLRESGSIEQMADKIIIMHRPKNTKAGANQDPEKGYTGRDYEIQMYVAKVRNGAQFMHWAELDRWTTKFT